MALRWLVDECVSARLVNRLREAGHNVVYVLEVASGADDREITLLANRDGRLLLTDDKDFGELVIRQKLAVPGLVLMRLESDDFRHAWKRLNAAIGKFGNDLFGRYTVIEPARFRSRRLRTDDVM
jgi:predicted nuclease of predicted toxin-antitoxin system